MKNRFYKILSVILAVAMIFSVYSIVTTAIEPTENSSRVVDYYVKNGGTGNGTKDVPAHTAQLVVQSYGSETLNLAFHDGRYQDQNL